MFFISAYDLHWMENTNETEDLCLHGHVIVKIGDESFEYNATVSSTALYLLKSLKEEHIINQQNQMLPCCGFFMIPNKDLSKVDILGCPNGIDWSVRHENDKIILITESGAITEIPQTQYRETVFAFADQIEAFYKSSSPKVLPNDDFERNGYIAFWNEWNSIRYE